jgi:glycosyltransferase involved in cell wall biosynthesis
MNVAIVDPGAYTLPYDFFYIEEVSKYYKVDFYYSKTKYNYEYIEKLRDNKNIKLIEYSISGSIVHKLIGIVNYLKMLSEILIKKNQYKKIHFMWNLYLPIEQVFFKLYGNKFIFTFHNNVPHSFKGKVFQPYQKINKLASKKIFVSQFTKNEFLSSYKNIGQYFLVNHGIMPLNEFEEKYNNSAEVKEEIVFWGRVEEYKGIDIFKDKLLNYEVKIFGKWNQNLKQLQNELSSMRNIQIIDDYLPTDNLMKLLQENSVFILPYKDATQSGVLYTLLAYKKVFISSDVGENSKFLKENGLERLVFNRDDEKSIIRAFEYAKDNYFEIKIKFERLKQKYKWENIMTEKKVMEIYE